MAAARRISCVLLYLRPRATPPPPLHCCTTSRPNRRWIRRTPWLDRPSGGVVRLHLHQQLLLESRHGDGRALQCPGRRHLRSILSAAPLFSPASRAPALLSAMARSSNDKREVGPRWGCCERSARLENAGFGVHGEKAYATVHRVLWRALSRTQCYRSNR
jgi:hypothetical protein